MQTLVSALVLTVFATPAALAACLEMPEIVTLKVDSVEADTNFPYAAVTASGFPPGLWRMRCAVRGKDGRYLGSDVQQDGAVPAAAPADRMLVPIGSDHDPVAGAECTAIPFVRNQP